MPLAYDSKSGCILPPSESLRGSDMRQQILNPEFEGLNSSEITQPDNF